MPDGSKSKRAQRRQGVFISYARSDGQAFAADLRRRLQAEGIALWQDLFGMEGGRDWWLQITDALDHVEFMALVITPSALQSTTVREEWRYARQEGVCVYPIKGIPDLDFSAMPRWMSEKHFYDLNEPLQWKKFLNDLNTRCEEPRVPFMVEPLPPDFVPRPAEFGQLLSYLLDRTSGDPVAITAALRGAGGYGKTTLAKALCHHEQIQNAFDDGILWVTIGENPGDLTWRVIDLIEVLTGERPGFSDLNAATTRLRELLADRDVLLVIDDVWDYTHLTPFIGDGAHGARLITTRIAGVLPIGSQRVDVDAMQHDEAVLLLSYGLRDGSEGNLSQMAQRLGEWPLLLELANRTLMHRVENLHQPLPKAIEWVNKSLDNRGLTTFDASEPKAREQAVSKCLGVSIELLDPNEQVRYRELAVFPEDIDVPLAALAKLWGRTGGLDDFDTEALCERLDRLSLLQRFDPNVRVIRLHDVVRGYLIGEQGENLAAVQNALLESHRTLSGARGFDDGAARWADLDLNEPYLWDHLAHHLIAADRADEFIATVKDLRYLVTKTLARKALSLEGDFLAAENVAPNDQTLRTLQRSFVQSSHVMDHCDDRDAEATLLGRLQGVPGLEALVEKLAREIRGPHLEAVRALPDLPDPALVRTFTGHSHWVKGCAISADGLTIVSASLDRTLKLWDARTGAELRTFVGHWAGVHACAITADGSIILSASGDRTLKLWDAHSGAEMRTLAGHSDMVDGCAFSADGSIILSASKDKTLKLWDARTGAELGTLAGHSSWINGCAISPDGSIIISGSWEGLKVWDARTGAELFTVGGESHWVESCAISPDRSIIVSASFDNTLKLWDARTGAELRTLAGHSGPVKGCSISADGSMLVSASVDKTIKLWDIRTGAELRTLPGHSDGVYDCAISADGSIVVSASDDKTLKLWDSRIRAEVSNFTGHSDEVYGCAISADSSMVVTASKDKTLKLWDARTGAELHTLAGHSGPVHGCAISADASIIVSAPWDDTLKLWDAHTGAELRTFAHSQATDGCAISADASIVVSASKDNTLKLWDARTGAELRTLAGHSSEVLGCAISADGAIIVSASWDETLKLWDTRTGSELHTLVGHSQSVNGCAIDADGLIVVSASRDETLKLWDARTGAELRTLVGHSGEVHGCAISADGSIVVSASEDKTLKVWEVRSGICLATLNVDRPLTGCVLYPDGEHIAAVGGRGVYFLRLVW